jgi:hypothetical protein
VRTAAVRAAVVALVLAAPAALALAGTPAPVIALAGVGGLLLLLRMTPGGLGDARGTRLLVWVIGAALLVQLPPLRERPWAAAVLPAAVVTGALLLALRRETIRPASGQR